MVTAEKFPLTGTEVVIASDDHKGCIQRKECTLTLVVCQTPTAITTPTVSPPPRPHVILYCQENFLLTPTGILPAYRQIQGETAEGETTGNIIE